MIALLLVVSASAPAVAQPAVGRGAVDAPAAGTEQQGTIAWFEGRPIDLSQSWGEARACLVWRQGGVLECFRSSEALDARASELRPDATSSTTTAASSYSCSSALRLFDYTWYGGRQLSFWDRGFWQNLNDYGFDERTESYAVGACYVHLALHFHGAGPWYPGPTYPYAGEPVMQGTWPNTISSIYIE